MDTQEKLGLTDRQYKLLQSILMPGYETATTHYRWCDEEERENIEWTDKDLDAIADLFDWDIDWGWDVPLTQAEKALRENSINNEERD